MTTNNFENLYKNVNAQLYQPILNISKFKGK